MTTDQVREVFRLILASYPTQRQRMHERDYQAMAIAYRAGLADLDADAAKNAVLRLVRTSKFIPSIAEIREEVGVVANGAKRTGLEAWSDVMRKVGSKGPSKSPGIDFHFEDPITAQIMSPALWRELCASDHIASERARFVEAYQLAQARERREVQASNGAVSKALPAPAREAVAQLEGMASDLASKLGGQRG